ncbi:MAG: hypothetical protein Q6368_003075 [Candidatus Baldrarchaeota archaeon]
MVVLNEKPYLNADELSEQPEIVEILDEGRLIPKEQSRWNREQFEIGIKLSNGDERIWRPNRASRLAMIKLFGKDTTKWIGRKVVLIKRRVTVFGQEKEVIYVDYTSTEMQNPSLKQETVK